MDFALRLVDVMSGHKASDKVAKAMVVEVPKLAQKAIAT